MVEKHGALRIPVQRLQDQDALANFMVPDKPRQGLSADIVRLPGAFGKLLTAFPNKVLNLGFAEQFNGNAQQEPCTAAMLHGVHV